MSYNETPRKEWVIINFEAPTEEILGYSFVNIDEFFCSASKFRFKMGLICESKLYLVSYNWHFERLLTNL